MAWARGNTRGKLARQARHCFGRAGEKGCHEVFQGNDSNLHLHEFGIRQIHFCSTSDQIWRVGLLVAIGSPLVLPPGKRFA